MTEPLASAMLFTTFAALVLASVVFSRLLERTGIPVGLVFLVIGMLAGSEGLLGIEFEDYEFAFRIGTAALVLILFDGGLNTPISSLKRVWAPASLLASVGVFGVAAITALGGRLMGLEWAQAMLLGAIVSSTDAAAVFSALRSSGISLRRRVGSTLEVESGLNDPMAVLLTVTLTTVLVTGETPSVGSVALVFVRELLLGGAMGWIIGQGARQLLRRLRLRSLGLYPVVTLGVALLAFGITTAMHGSGFLAVYVAGVVIGNGELPYRAGVLRTQDAMAWLSQIIMYLVFGLLVFPQQLPSVAVTGLSIALVLVFVARPLMTALLLAPFGYSIREIAYIGWVGLRGAVPIVLAIYPVLFGATGAQMIFNVVFFIVVVNAVLPGATIAYAARSLEMDADEPPRPHAIVEVESMDPLRGELLTFYVDEALAVTGVPLSELPFPDGAAASLIIRGSEMIPPRGITMLEHGDYVYVVARPQDRELILLMFGRPEE
jgi:cell volume regulation protein A